MNEPGTDYAPFTRPLCYNARSQSKPLKSQAHDLLLRSVM
jgi:hypothetical protein